MKKAPFPKKIKKSFFAHGDLRVDYFYWLRDDKRKNKNILNYLKRENKYTDHWFEANNVNSKDIFQKYKNSIPKYEESFKTKIDDYYYFSTASISQEYRKYYQIFKKKKKLILDVNRLAKDKDFFAISGIYPSRNHNLIAYGEDTNGRREYSIIIKDLEKNKNIEKNLCSSTGSIIWSKNSEGYFYLKKDPKTLITNSLFFHKLGTKNKNDLLIYKEKDNQFSLGLSLSRTKKFLLLNISKTESNEIRYVDLNEKEIKLKCFLKRKNKHLYYVDDTPDNFFILSNRQKKINFELYKTELTKTSEIHWKIQVAHKKNEIIEDFLCFKDFIVLETRRNGLSQIIQFNK